MCRGISAVNRQWADGGIQEENGEFQRDRSIEPEYTLAPCIDVGDERGEEKEEDSSEKDTRHWSGRFDLPERRRPGIKENNLDIEDEKGDGEQVIADVETFSSRRHGVHTALVNASFDGSVTSRSEQMRGDEYYHRKSAGHCEEEEDRPVRKRDGAGVVGRESGKVNQHDALTVVFLMNSRIARSNALREGPSVCVRSAPYLWTHCSRFGRGSHSAGRGSCWSRRKNRECN